MSRRTGILALVLLVAVAGVLLLLTGTLDLTRLLPWGARDAPEDADASTLGVADREALLEDLRERAVLRGLPGVRTAGGGTGRLTGGVQVHVAGGEPRPLPGVKVEAVAVEDGRTLTLDAATDAEGRFAIDPIPALAGWAVIVRHAPWREVVLRGVVVTTGNATDVGAILLGAPASLEGAVVDAAGRPVAGAEVQVLRDAGRAGAVDFQRAFLDLQSAVDPLARSEADRDGRFLVAGLPPGRYVLRVGAPGFAAVFREGVLVTTDEHGAEVRVVLDPGAGWTGRVVDEEGTPVGGARILAIPTPGGPVSRLDRIETRSASDGSYRLDTLVSGLRYFVEVWAEGFAPAGRFLVPRGTGSLDLVVVRAGRIEGTITDEGGGGGVAGAEVTVLAGLTNSLSPVAAVTDDAGRYVIPAVSPGPVFLMAARAPGYQRRNFDVGKGGPWRVEAGGVLRMDLALPRGAAVGGRVLATDGSPVPYAVVGLLDTRDRWEGERTSVADAAGRYRIESLRPATYEIRVSAPGYAPLLDAEDPWAARLEIPAGAPEVARDLVLARGAELHGKVATPDGEAVARARVTLESGDAAVAAQVRDLAAVTDPGGRWRIRGVPPAAGLRLRAEHDGWAPALVEAPRLSAGEQREVDLVLREGARLPGRATDARGRAVEGARVRWGLVGPGDEGRLGDAFRADELLGTRVLRTDGDGRFEIDRLEGGRYVLKLEAEGFSDWYRKDLVLSGEGVQAAVTAVLEGAQQIRGRVVDAATGAPIQDAWVYAREQDPAEGEVADPGRVKALSSAQTAADGSYVLERVPPGRFEVVAWLALGYRASAQDWKNPDYRRRDVTGGAKGVDFRLPPEVVR